jgi:FtsP/CotA-like multicopper oxidase with cupredoxin domain
MSRRDMLRTMGMSAGALIGWNALNRNFVYGTETGDTAGSLYIETYPTSPLILEPFTDPLPIPNPTQPLTEAEARDRWGTEYLPYPNKNQQDCDFNHGHNGYHQLWPNNTAEGLYLPQPLMYDITMQVSKHRFTSSPVQPIDRDGNPVTPPGSSNDGPRNLPDSVIYGFNGGFPGAMIYARYYQPVLLRIQNYLADDHGYDCGDFGDPERKFLTHLHNGHTAAESDGNPNHREGGYGPSELAGQCGQWCDNLYLNYPAGGDSREMQSFMWFHDHTHGHTGANVYKGMVGLYPIYDPQNDPGDERKGYRLPGVPRYVSRTDTTDITAAGEKTNTSKPDKASSTGDIDYSRRIEYDLPLALYDCAFDDGVTQHKDAHSGAGETHPEWWGQTYFKHFPNHGFVGDVFTVNCKAFPVLEVKRRRYRLRFLDASIARCYELWLMSPSAGTGPMPAKDTGRSGAGLQGQYQLPGAQQSMVFTQISAEGGLLPFPIVRDSIELWPAKRKEVIVDFSKYMDGTPTTKGDVLYLVNTMKMANGRKPNSWPTTHNDLTGQDVEDPEFDPSYAVPVMKIVIGGDASDNSIDPLDYDNKVDGKATLRMVPDAKTGALIPALRMRALPSLPKSFKGLPVRTFELQRSGTYGGEIEWLINGHAFDSADPNGMHPQAVVTQGRPELWVIRNGGGGWTHPMHMHQEEHRVIARSGGPGRPTDLPDGRRIDDESREDVVNLDPSEEVVIYRNFRTFKGKYVAHCHNLAHEDHAMMFGWEIH